MGHMGSERRLPEPVQWQEAKQKKCRALAGAGVPAQAMPAVNGTRSSARSGVAYRLGGNIKAADSANSSNVMVAAKMTVGAVEDIRM